MSTTTVGDLLDRADYQACDLRHAAEPSTLSTWLSFESTAGRLLRELVGPLRTDSRDGLRAHAALNRLLKDFPHPTAPSGTTDPQRTVTLDARPADPTSTDPLARLAVTLGVLADLLVQARERSLATWTGSDLNRILDHTQIRPVIAHLLAITTVAGRHALTHLPLTDVERPLAVAKYAEHALDTLGGCGDLHEPSTMTDLACFAPPVRPVGPNEHLEAALRAWVSCARAELARTIPSTEVLRNITNQALHLYAATDQLLTASPTARRVPTDEAAAARAGLRDAADAMGRVEPLWAAVTTATPPSHDYVAATTTLFNTFSALTRDPATCAGVTTQLAKINVPTALTDLRYTSAELVDLLHTSAALPDILIRSKVLYAPARLLPGSLDRLHARRQGHWVALRPREGVELKERAMAAASAATTVHTLMTTTPPGRNPRAPTAPLILSHGRTQDQALAALP